MTSEETRDIAIEARTLAREAHKRLTDLGEAVTAIRADIAALKDAVARLSTKLGFGAALGGLIGSGLVALALHYLN